MPKNMQWQSRIAWFWYRDNDIFDFTQTQITQRIKEYADSGIDTVIGFSNTHFRWCYYLYWDKINETIARMCDACHEFGIKFVEHHSCSLILGPIDENKFKTRCADIDLNYWKEVKPFLCSDPLIKGTRLSSMLQVDGRTGEISGTQYDCNVFCYNNPDFRRIYFTYLEDVYKAGADGIMTDDVQYFGSGHACSCVHCRRLFREQTGYEIPSPGEGWESFWGDYDNPVYVAWEKFRRDSADSFQIAVNRHYEALGYKMLRPNYISDIIYHNRTAYPFEKVSWIWDCIFQENCYNSITKYSWPDHAMEAVHRYALARRNDIPSMSLFYNTRSDSYYFSWALANSWGQLFSTSPDSESCKGRLLKLEKKYRSFEKEHENILYNTKKQADIGFYFSFKTRDYVKNAAADKMSSLMACMQAAYFTNKSIDMVFEDDDPMELQKYSVISLNHVSMLSDNEFSNFKEYVNKGGILLITGLPGERRTDGSIRSSEEIIEKLGLDCSIITVNRFVNTVMIDGLEYEYGFKAPIENVIKETVDGIPVGISIQTGKGTIIWVSVCTNKVKVHKNVSSGRAIEDGKSKLISAPYYAARELKEKLGPIFDSIVTNPLLDTSGLPEYWIATCLKSSNGSSYIIHVLNMEGTLAENSDSQISHDDIIMNFCEKEAEDYTIGEEAYISLRWEESGNIKSVLLHTPERAEDFELNWRLENRRLIIKLNYNLFRGYGIIEIKL